RAVVRKRPAVRRTPPVPGRDHPPCCLVSRLHVRSGDFLRARQQVPRPGRSSPHGGNGRAERVGVLPVSAMTYDHQQIGAAAARRARRLPHSLMMSVAGVVARCGSFDRAASRQTILQCVPTPTFRDATAEFIDLWYTVAGGVGAEAVAMALVTAASCELYHRHE